MSCKFNSSHCNLLIINTLKVNVMSDEFLINFFLFTALLTLTIRHLYPAIISKISEKTIPAIRWHI